MKQSLAGDAVKLSISRIITNILTLVVAMLLSRFLTKHEYGTYSAALIVINLAITIFTLGLPNSITYFLSRAETQQERQKFLSVYYTLNTILSIVAGLALVSGISLIVKYFNNPLIKSIWYFLAVFPWTRMILTSLENVLVIYKKTRLLLLFRLTNSSAVVIIIVISQILRIGFTGFMLVYVCSQAIFTIIAYVVIRGTAKKLTITFDRQLIRTIFKFALPMGLAAVVGIINKEFDKLFIGGVLGPESLAIYTNAAKELPVTFIAASFTAVLLPAMTLLVKQKRVKEGVMLWNDCTIISYLFICFFSFAIFAFATDAITALYSDKYLSGIVIFRIYTLVLLFRCTYFGIMLNALGKTRIILYSSIAAVIVNIIGNFSFYYTIGFYGPAISTVISKIFSVAFMLTATCKLINIPIKEIFPWKSVFIITFVNAVIGVALYYVKAILPMETVIGSLMESIILCIVWAGLLLIIYRRSILEKWRRIKEH